MSIQIYTPEFKEEAVRQVLEKNHSVPDVAERHGAPHCLYKWVNAVKPSDNEAQANEFLEAKQEVLKLRAELKRPQEECDTLKWPQGISRKTPSEVPVSSRASPPLEHPDALPNARDRARRLLPVAPQVHVEAGHRRSTATRPDQGLLCCKPRSLRVTSSVLGSAGSGPANIALLGS
jgi:transposase